MVYAVVKGKTGPSTSGENARKSADARLRRVPNRPDRRKPIGIMHASHKDGQKVVYRSHGNINGSPADDHRLT